MTGHPALMRREIIGSGFADGREYVVVRETWDLTAPDCPFAVISSAPKDTKEGE